MCEYTKCVELIEEITKLIDKVESITCDLPHMSESVVDGDNTMQNAAYELWQAQSSLNSVKRDVIYAREYADRLEWLAKHPECEVEILEDDIPF